MKFIKIAAVCCILISLCSCGTEKTYIDISKNHNVFDETAPEITESTSDETTSEILSNIETNADTVDETFSQAESATETTAQAESATETTAQVESVPETSAETTTQAESVPETLAETTAKAESAEVKYVLNTNSKKFHLPDCSSAKRISQENYGTVSSREEAIADGYSPCKICNP